MGGLFSDIIKAQSQMQDEWLAHCSHWATSVVKWRVRRFRYVEETFLSVVVFHTLKRKTAKVRGGRLTLKALPRHQWPARMDGLERAELTENSQGDASRGSRLEDIVCVARYHGTGS